VKSFAAMTYVMFFIRYLGGVHELIAIAKVEIVVHMMSVGACDLLSLFIANEVIYFLLRGYYINKFSLEIKTYTDNV
jgi:hypothetical protein